MKNVLAALFLSVVFLVGPALSLPLQEQELTVGSASIILRVPQGMQVEFVAEMSRPRLIAFGPDGEMIVGSRSGNIYRLPPPYGQAEVLVSLGGYPHSAAYRNGMLYVADTDAVLAAPYRGIASRLTPGDFARVTPLPAETGGHSSRTIVRGPDGRLYVGLGISSNCSDEYLDNSYPFQRRRGGVFVLEGTTLRPYASGLRNPIGLAFHPRSGVLYATNAGPDNLGYDQPPEVLARLSQGSFHGMPWFQYYNGAFRSGECASSAPPRPASQAIPPVAFFSPRSTPQGIAFLERSSMGEQYEGSAVVAIHGSWAERPGAGEASRWPPKLNLVNFDASHTAGKVEDLITGFQRQDGSRFARPSGVAVGTDGHVYFTSDGGDVTGIFRLKASAPFEPGTTLSSIYGLLLSDRP